jgi:uncharacterized membrane protein YcaP (DUF421 family)
LTSGDLFKYAVSPAELVLRAIVIYLVLLVVLRLFGKREVGQFTLYDLVLVLLVANAVQPAITGPDTSLAGGVVIILTLVLVNYGIGQLNHRFKLFHRIFVGMATEIVVDGEYIEHNLDREGLTEDEVESAVREHGLSDVKEVRRAYLEPDGSISVVPREGGYFKMRRRTRTRAKK